MKPLTFFLLVALASACGSRAPRTPSPEPPTEADEEPDTDVTPPPPSTGPRDGWDFDHAKTTLTKIYTEHGPHHDLYCGCPFSPAGHGFSVDLRACGYAVASEPARAERIEWEHAVPAAHFGRTFEAWTSGDPRCRSSRGKAFRGRSCARKVSRAFARIEGDMHNLFPVVGEVNALRADLPMGEGLLGDPARADGAGRAPRSVTFGACGTRIVAGALSPRREIRGDLARAYLYMAATYPDHVALDDAHRALFVGWDREDPPDAWERERSALIARIQGADNPFVVRGLSAAE